MPAHHLCRWPLLVVAGLSACSTPAGNQPAVGAGPRQLVFRDTASHTVLSLDDEDFFPLLAEPTMARFQAAQGQGFRLSTDTVINDERGIFTGPRLSRGHSYLQWLDGQLREATIVDPAIRLNHNLQVGLTKAQVQQRLKLAAPPGDTLVFDTGYMSNHCTLFFYGGRLHTVYLTDLPD